jgi:arylformamidase
MLMKNGMLVYPGDPDFRITPVYQRQKGDSSNLSLMSMGTHAGTHVDSPNHFLENGASVDELPLESLIGPGIVLDMQGRSCIDREALASSPIGEHVRVLFKTDSGRFLSQGIFRGDHTYLAESGAHYLIEKGVSLVGIDFLSIEAHANQDAPIHRLLLQAGIVILEGACLQEVPPGSYEILCLPLRIKDADGAPARLVLRQALPEKGLRAG